jgi:hypothetical protein
MTALGFNGIQLLIAFAYGGYNDLGVLCLIATVLLAFCVPGMGVFFAIRPFKALERVLVWTGSFVIASLLLQSMCYVLFGKIIRATAERARPLVNAIYEYETNHLESPPDLETLVPYYISRDRLSKLEGAVQYDIAASVGFDPHTMGARQWSLTVVAPSLIFGANYVYYPEANHDFDENYGEWKSLK